MARAISKPWLLSSFKFSLPFLKRSSEMQMFDKFKAQDIVPYSFAHIRETPWPEDTLAIPSGVACLALGLQFLRALFVAFKYCFKSTHNTQPKRDDTDDTLEIVVSTARRSLRQRIEGHIRRYGGFTIFGFMVARLAGCVALLHLSAVTLTKCEVKPTEKWRGLTVFPDCPESCMTATYFYATLLALVSLGSKRWGTSATRLNIVILLSALAVYAYRDLWPLATFTQQPEDIAEGKLLWVKISLLIFTAALVPLFIPRRYVPIDSKNPMPVPNPEQTASIASLMTYAFLDSIIYQGYKVPHLSANELPPLADYDAALYQTNQAFVHLDVFNGAKRRHLFFALMRVFRKEYIILAMTILAQSICSFASPIGINRILNYLETGGANAKIRPWFWIIWLFLGPMFFSFAFHWYIFIATRTLVRAECILTELIFEHSLRIRLKSETSNDPAAQAAPTAVESATPGNVATTGADERASRAEASGSQSQTPTAVASREPSTASQTTVEASAKGKSKAPPEPPKQEQKATKGDNFIGKLNNLITTDLQNIVGARDFLIVVLYIPLQIILCMVFLYQVLGWSAFVGFILTIALMPVPGYIATRIRRVQATKMKMTDARVQTVTESVNVLRMIKLFGWEGKMTQRIQAKREEELRWLWKLRSLEITNGLLSYFIPTFTMLVTYAIYAVIMKEELTASKIFSSMSVFSLMREQFQRVLFQTSPIIQGKVSLDRVGEFLQTTELLDSYAEPPSQASVMSVSAIAEPNNAEFGFRSATFAWSKEAEDNTHASNRSFKLQIDGELLFRRGRINLIIGPTGSGKTSVLMALLGEMHYIPSSNDSWFYLPRDGGVAYAAQESWVQNDTIRNNILFGSPYEEERYSEVIKQCALEQDLELFEAGDKTEVGERGLTLSGGQKARITLARAIYSPAEIVLLDDVLAALDVHTSSWIVDQCFRGGLVKGRTILLVTHNIALASPIADFVVSISSDGIVRTQGTDLSIAFSHDPTLALEVEHDKEVTEIGKEDIDAPIKKYKDGKLVLAEEIAQGHITWKSLNLLINGLGGNYPVLFFVTFIGGFIVTELTMTFQTWFLGYWASQYEGHTPSEVNVQFYLALYVAILFVTMTAYSSSYMFFIFGTIRAARSINTQLIESIFGSTVRWLDETPTGRIIARCTQDIRAVDGFLPQLLLIVIDCILTMLTELGAVVLFTPVFLFPGLGVAVLGAYLGNMYIKAQLSVKRETSNAQSPVLSHFGAAIHGLVSIRAYGAQNAFKAESLNRINHYTRVSRTSYNLNRWVSIRIDAIGALFSSALALYLVYGPGGMGSANAGFSLSMAVQFSGSILWMVKMFNEFEVQSNSLERIQGYIDIEHEPKPTELGKPPAAWPTNGDLRVEKLSARYSKTGPKVLHDISFHINSGQRIGVVGRSGSGKSSLTLALLRCILTEGTVYYDGIPTHTVNLDALRSNITIIPQTPELLSGTLRENLDPFEHNDDATLNDALRAAGLFSLQEEAGEARINLDTKIAGSGTNLSVGQRQILALARAIIRRSKLLILDEATSAIDYKTDSVIQSTLRSQIGNDVTVITVAHRLQTIMDADRIMVLDNGRIAEFGSPKELLKNEQGMLRALVEGSGDKDALYALADSLIK